MVPTVFYSQNFNGLGSGLPANWTTGTGATSAGLGTTIAFSGTAPAEWAATASGFKNFASTTGLTSTSLTAEQAASADRALGIRQSSGFGDPGAAFNYAFSTTGQTIDSVSLDLLMLSVQGRSTTWSVEYGLGASPTSFTTLGTWPDPNAWGSTAVTYSGTAVSGMSNQANVVFRVAAISGTATGSGSRDSMGIDNFQISNLSSSAASATLGITTSGSTTYSGPISITGTATLTAVAGGTATFSGIISGTAGSIIKTGLGTVILTGTNTYAAGTSITAGTLKAGNSNSFGSGSVTLSAGATLDLNSLTFANTITNNGGTLANAGSFSGTSSVSGTADYSGAVGGTVVVDAGGVANFSGSINSLTVSAGGQANLNDGSSLIQTTLTNDGLLVANRSSDATLSTAISGSGAFEKLGSGILTVTGNSTYSGATTVSAGRLKVNGSLGSGGLSVAASAWLMGTGTVNGPVTVSGTFSPGSSPGVITLGSLSLTSTSTTIIEVLGATRGTSYDGIDIATASGLTYGGLLSFEFGGSALADGTYDIFNFAGTSSGSFASLDSTGFYAGTWTNNSNGSFTLVKDAQTLTFSQSTGDIIVVPEPATLALAAAGAAALACALRRRR
jgi:autotransporter-associated beta strand protein